MSVRSSGSAASITEKYFYPLQDRQEKDWEVVEDYTARETFEFSRPARFGREKRISMAEASERVAKSEPIQIERKLAVRWQDEKGPRIRRNHKVTIENGTQLAEYAEEFGHRGTPTRVFLVESKSGSEWVHPDHYRAAWINDHNSDFSVSSTEVKIEMGLKATDDEVNNLLADMAALDRPRSKLTVDKTSLAGALLEAQSQAVLSGDIEEAVRLARGEKTLEEQKLLKMEPGLSLASLIDQMSEDSSPEQVRAALKTDPLAQGELGLAHYAVTEAVKVSASATLFPPAPLVADLRQQLEKLRLSGPDPRGLAQISRLDDLLDKAHPEDSLTELFQRVRKNEKDLGVFQDLVTTVGGDVAMDGLKAVDFESLAKRAGANLEIGELGIYERKSQSVLKVLKAKSKATSNPKLLDALEAASGHLNNRLAQLRELKQEIARKKEEDAVNRVVTSIMEDDSLSQFLQRAGEKLNAALLNSRVDLELSKMSEPELSVDAPEQKKAVQTSETAGYVTRKKVKATLEEATSEAILAGDVTRARLLHEGNRALAILGGKHNGEMFARIFDSAEGQDLEAVDLKEALQAPEKHQSALAYHALKVATEPVVREEAPSLTDIHHQLESDSLSAVGRPEALEYNARARKIVAKAASDHGWDGGLHAVLETHGEQDLTYFIQAISRVESTDSPTARYEPKGNQGVAFFRSSLESDLRALEARLELAEIQTNRDNLGRAVAVVKDRLEQLGEFEQKLKENRLEREINALVSSVLEDRDMEKVAQEVDARASSAIVESRTDLEMSDLETSPETLLAQAKSSISP